MEKLLIASINALLLGFLTKLVDLEVDEGLDLRGFSYVLALLYGLDMIHVMRSLTELSSMILGVLTAVIISGKIDSLSHGIGVGTALAGTFLSVPKIDREAFFLFLSAALLDEIISDLADRGKFSGKMGKLLRIRPLLELATLSYSIYVRSAIFWIFIFVYDLSYQLTSALIPRQGVQDVQNRSSGEANN